MRIFIYFYCVVMFSIEVALFNLQGKVDPINFTVQVMGGNGIIQMKE